ncbi:MAG: hypothetical protein SPI59_07005 [Finegoldia sp.]|nr:hypothetical protein [Finegoldia sp.]
MNGEVEQLISMASLAKKILIYREPLAYQDRNYINRIGFQVAGLFGKKILPTFGEWIKHIEKKNYNDLKLYLNPEIDDLNTLGFSNMHRGKIVVYILKGKVFEYSPIWSFDKKIDRWNILYIEEKVDEPQAYEDGSSFDIVSFDQTIKEISQFAIKIGADNFVKYFDFARDKLWSQDPHKSYQSILSAVYSCDVFGGMGSWNDEPYALAEEMGLTGDYVRLSKALLRQVRLGAMYCVNDW